MTSRDLHWNKNAFELFINIKIVYYSIEIKISKQLKKTLSVLNYCIRLKSSYFEWGSTAQNLIARQSIGRHFWQEINYSTQNLSTARIKLSRAQPDSSSWHFFLVQDINWKSQFLPIEMVNNVICHTCSWPKITFPYLT
jgi:hypothetical protein